MAYASHREPFVDVEDGWGSKGNRSSLDASFEFAERQVRQGFIRKVFGILSAQLVLTAAVTAAFVTSPSAKTFVAANPWVLWTSMLGGLATILVLACSESARRSHPTNLILLFTFTAFESVLVGLTSSMFNAQVVLLAAAVTAGVTVALTLFAMQTKYDLTMGSGVLLSLLTGLIVASLVQMFVHAPWLHLLLATGGAILFSAYLVFDVQLMMGGHRLSISPDEYVFAALNVYLDIINIFLQLLQIINELSRSQ